VTTSVVGSRPRTTWEPLVARPYNGLKLYITHWRKTNSKYFICRTPI
jgi:hypothetical protein